MSTQKCIILAGGLGTRLRSIVADKPKCLAPVRGRPFLYWQLKSLYERGIQQFILSLGYQAEQVSSAIRYFDLPVDISCIHEPEALGTGGAIAYVMDQTGDTELLVANGDTYIGGDLDQMFSPLHADELLRLGVTYVLDRTRFGGLEFDHAHRVTAFIEKGVHGAGAINAGLYRINRRALPDQNPAAYSLESEIFPRLVDTGNICVVMVSGPFIDIGVPEDYARYCRDEITFR